MREIWNRLTGKQYFRPLIIFMIILLFNGIVSKGEFFLHFPLWMGTYTDVLLIL